MDKHFVPRVIVGTRLPTQSLAHVVCLALSCEYNHNAECSDPSRHKISADGTCAGKVIKPIQQVAGGTK